jgi:hypothetical protein
MDHHHQYFNVASYWLSLHQFFCLVGIIRYSHYQPTIEVYSKGIQKIRIYTKEEPKKQGTSWRHATHTTGTGNTREKKHLDTGSDYLGRVVIGAGNLAYCREGCENGGFHKIQDSYLHRDLARHWCYSPSPHHPPALPSDSCCFAIR